MNSNLFELDNDVAAVIGGTGELGGLMAESLGAYGAKVAVIGRNADRGSARANKLVDAGGTAVPRRRVLGSQKCRDQSDDVAGS